VITIVKLVVVEAVRKVEIPKGFPRALSHLYNIPGSLHGYPHADSSLLQVPIESLCFSTVMIHSLSPHSPVSSTKNTIC